MRRSTPGRPARWDGEKADENIGWGIRIAQAGTAPWRSDVAACLRPNATRPSSDGGNTEAKRSANVPGAQKVKLRNEPKFFGLLVLHNQLK
jgi:hypothetical protein